MLDDSGAYGVGIADRSRSGPRRRASRCSAATGWIRRLADYTTVLTKIKSLNPDALYYGGVSQAGVKLAKQSYDILPKVIKGGGDGMYSAEMLSAAGFPAAEGWYATIASPHADRGQGGRCLGEAVSGEVQTGAVRLRDHRV